MNLQNDQTRKGLIPRSIKVKDKRKGDEINIVEVKKHKYRVKHRMFAKSIIYTQTYLYNDFLEMIIKGKHIL